MSDLACPTTPELLAFLAVRPPATTDPAVAEHVRACENCRRQVRLLAPAAPAGEPTALRTAATGPFVAADSAAATATAAWQRPAGGAAVATRAGTAFRPRPAGPGHLSRPESEVRDLLHFRLRVVTACILGGLLFFLVQFFVPALQSTAVRRDWVWYDQGLIVLAAVVQAGGLVALWRFPQLSVRWLRAAEWLAVGTGVAYLAGNRFSTLTNAAAQTGLGPAGRELYIEHATLLNNLAWVLGAAFYGLLVPNTWRRSVTVLAGFVLLPLLVTALAAQVDPALAAKLPLLLGVTATVLLLTTALAAFGSFKISTLQFEALAARQEARELGQYRLARKIGGGGMGEVYLAEHGLLKRACAIKLIRPQHASDPAYLRRFEREVRETSRLNHPNTVEIYDYGHTDDGTFYYVMEYLPGVTLDELVRRHGPVPPARAVHLLRQLCSALRAAHGVGLIHRDIKPGNVMLCGHTAPHDRVKLLDFGLVRAAEPEDTGSRLTREGVIVGTPEYMSPEQAEGKAAIDPRSDLYSLGAVAYFLLAGRPPFQGANGMRVLIDHLQTPVPPLKVNCLGVPADVEAVVHRCLAKSADERFADAASLERALAACSGIAPWTEEDAAAWWRHVPPAPIGPALTPPSEATAGPVEPPPTRSVT